MNSKNEQDKPITGSVVLKVCAKYIGAYFCGACFIALTLYIPMCCLLVALPQFFSSYDGNVAAVSGLHGGRHVQLENGTEIVWRVAPFDPPAVGDRVTKAPNSFHYELNGKVLYTSGRIMFYIFSCYPAILLSLLVIDSSYFIIHYRITGETVFETVTGGRKEDSVGCVLLPVMPMLLLLYIAVYLVVCLSV